MVKVGYSDAGTSKLEAMTQQPDGSWTYSAPSSSSSVRYMLELVVPNDINYILNPSEPKVSTENEKHQHYLQSLAEVKASRISPDWASGKVRISSRLLWPLAEWKSAMSSARASLFDASSWTTSQTGAGLRPSSSARA